MLKFKRNPGGKIKEKVVFKFQFHVTRVPQSGWEKLKVSLVPQDTGKRTNKTTKASVEYGCCRWPDPIVETAKLYRDGQSGDYDDKFYKLVVGVRTKILGEITVNLADFANSPSNSIAVPLENCRGNTLLHAKINSLTSLRKSRELSSVQDDQSSDSEVEVDNISLASSTSQALSGPLPMESLRDTDIEPFTPRDYNGSLKDFYADPPSPASSLGGYERRRRRFSQGSFPTMPMEPQLGRAPSTSSTNSNIDAENLTPRAMSAKSSSFRSKSPIDAENLTPRAMSVRSSSFRSKSPIEIDRPGQDKTVQELRMEAVTWQRRARNLSLELLKFKQENGGGGGSGGGKMAERIKLDFQAAKQEQESLRKQAEELDRSVKDLKIELAYEKESSLNASSQLRRAQESNKQLVLAIKDMEESLEEQRKTVEELSSINHDLESSLHATKTREENLEGRFSEMLAAKEAVLGGLQARIDELGIDRVVKVKREDADTNGLSRVSEGIDRDEMAKELRDLTEENTELLTKLNKSTKDLETKVDEQNRMKIVVDELEKKLVSTEEFHQAQHSSNEKLMVRLQTLIQGLKGANADLENQLRGSDADIRNLSSELELARGQRVAAEQDLENLTKMVDNSGTANAQLESQVAMLVFQAQKSDRQMSDLLNDFNSKLLQVSDLESRTLQLEMLNNGLEMKIQDSEEISKSRILELESQITTLSNNLAAAEEDSEILRNQLAMAKSEIDRHDLEKKVLEDDAGKLKLDLEARLSRSKDENVEVSETVTRKDAEVQFLATELESFKQQLISEQAQGREIEKQKAVLAAMMNEYKSKWIESDRVCGMHSQARQELGAQIERLNAEVSKYSTSNDDLECRIRELEQKFAELQSECIETKNKMEEDGKCSRMTILGLESESESLKLKVEGVKSENASLEQELRDREREKKVLDGNVRTWENTCRGLKMKIAMLEESCEVHRIEEEKLELQVRDSEETLRVLETAARSREGFIKELEERLEDMKTNHQQDLRKLEIDVAELEKDNAEYVDRNAALQERISAVIRELECCKVDAEEREMKNRQEQLELEEKVVSLESEGEILKQEGRRLQMELIDLKSDIDVRVGTQAMLEKRIQELEDRISRAVEELKLCEVQKSVVEDRNQELETAIERWKVANRGLEATIGRLERESDSRRIAAEELELEIKNLDEKVGELERFGSLQENRIRELEGSLSAAEQAETDLKKKIIDLEGDNAKLVEKVTILQEQLRDLTSELERFKLDSEEAQSIHNREKLDLEQQLLQLESKRESLEKQGQDLEIQVKNLKSDAAIHAAAQELLEKQNKELESAMAASQASSMRWKSKVLVLESDCELLETEKDDLETKLADLQHRVLESATLQSTLQDRVRNLEESEKAILAEKSMLEAQVTELNASIGSIDRERESIVEAWNSEKIRAFEAEKKLEVALGDGEKLQWLSRELDAITRQIPADSEDLEELGEETQIDSTGSKVEQSIATLSKLATRIGLANEEIDFLRAASRDSDRKLADYEQQISDLAAENEAYKPEQSRILNLRQEKLFGSSRSSRGSTNRRKRTSKISSPFSRFNCPAN